MAVTPDPLAAWYVHTLAVERWNGTEAYGDDFDDAEQVTGFYSDKTEYAGGQVFVTGKFAFPMSVAYVPVQSRVTLPDLFGGRVTRVQTSAVGDAGGQPVPAHQEIGLL